MLSALQPGQQRAQRFLVVGAQRVEDFTKHLRHGFLDGFLHGLDGVFAQRLQLSFSACREGGLLGPRMLNRETRSGEAPWRKPLKSR